MSQTKVKVSYREQYRLLLISFLSEGLSPRAIALGLAIGVTVGLFPVIGFSSLVCILVAHPLRLNHSLVQGANWAVTSLALLLIIPFLRLSEFVLRVDPLSLEDFTRTSWKWTTAATELWHGLLHAVFGWLLCAPVIFSIVYATTLLTMRRIRRQPEASVPLNPEAIS